MTVAEFESGLLRCSTVVTYFVALEFFCKIYPSITVSPRPKTMKEAKCKHKKHALYLGPGKLKHVSVPIRLQLVRGGDRHKNMFFPAYQIDESRVY